MDAKQGIDNEWQGELGKPLQQSNVKGLHAA